MQVNPDILPIDGEIKPVVNLKSEGRKDYGVAFLTKNADNYSCNVMCIGH